MNLESQVCSFNIAKRLKELGVKQKSAFFWTSNRELARPLARHEPLFHWVSAFNVAELGEMLPFPFESGPGAKGGFQCSNRDGTLFKIADTEADARAKMLCYLIEKGIVKP